MGNTGFYHLSGSHQHHRRVDSPNRRLLYSPVLSPAVYLRRLPVLHGTYFHCIALTSDYLITHYKLCQYGKFKQKRGKHYPNTKRKKTNKCFISFKMIISCVFLNYPKVSTILFRIISDKKQPIRKWFLFDCFLPLIVANYCKCK